MRGEIGADSGWVIDFADISAAWEPLAALLDHRYLNEIPGLETSPTSENLAIWIWDRIAPGAAAAQQGRGARDLHQRLRLYG